MNLFGIFLGRNPKQHAGRAQSRFTLLGFLLIGSAPLFGLGPDALSGYILKETDLGIPVVGPTRVFATQDRTILFESDGTYRTIVEWTHSYLPHRVAYTSTLRDGTYTYSRLAADRAVVTFAPAGGTSFQTTLLFTSERAGREAGSGATFSIDSSSAEFPLTNCSTRVPVVRGKPSIIGFIVGGSPPKDVLIRVVGPGLADFGVPGYWREPRYRLHGDAGPDRFLSAKEGSWDSTPDAAEAVSRVTA